MQAICLEMWGNQGYPGQKGKIKSYDWMTFGVRDANTTAYIQHVLFFHFLILKTRHIYDVIVRFVIKVQHIILHKYNTTLDLYTSKACSLTLLLVSVRRPIVVHTVNGNTVLGGKEKVSLDTIKDTHTHKQNIDIPTAIVV